MKSFGFGLKSKRTSIKEIFHMTCDCCSLVSEITTSFVCWKCGADLCSYDALDEHFKKVHGI